MAEEVRFYGGITEFIIRSKICISKNSAFFQFHRVIMGIDNFCKELAILDYINIPTWPNITVGISKRLGFDNG